MRLQSFRIKNFRSIKDSGNCHLASDITILAGKNESGKSSVLEALNMFKAEPEEINSDDIYFSDSEQKFSIECTFEYSTQEFMEGLDDEPSDLVRTYLEENNFSSVLLTVGGLKSFSVTSDTILHGLYTTIRQNAFHKFKEINREYGKLAYSLANPPKPLDVFGKTPSNVRQIIVSLEEFTTKFLENPHNYGLREEDFSEVKKLVAGELNEIKSDLNFWIDAIETIKHHLPKFIYFNSFLDVLKFSRPIGEAKDDALLVDFCNLAGIDLDYVAQVNLGDPDEKRKLDNNLNERNTKITGNFSNYWNQDQVDLQAQVSDGNFTLTIADEGETHRLKPDQRSAGLKWFLAFFLRIKASYIENSESNSVILIDEPGLVLHAKAQKDVLEVLQSMAAEGVQIIFSTHSPYLIDAQKINRVRLVTKDSSNGTVISNKPHASADNETLTPISTAIGLDLTQGLGAITDTNVIVEGISDYYYLSKFYQLKGNQDGIRILPCTGASKMSTLASLLVGYGANFCTVFDNDQAGKRAAKEMKNFGLQEKKIIFVSDENSSGIEDLFTVEDFQEYVVNDETLEILDNDTVTKFMQRHKVSLQDKVLMSKSFFENEGLSWDGLSQDTQNRVKALFKKISDALTPKE